MLPAIGGFDRQDKMTDLSIVELLIDVINATDKLNGEQFNKNPEAINAYRIVYGETALNQIMSSKTDLHLNRFYLPDWILETFVKEKSISTNNVKSLIENIENKSTKNWIKIFLIERAIDLQEFDLAEILIQELPDEDKGPVRYVGHRKMLKHYAEIGNEVEFKKRLKFSKPAKFPRNEIGGFKGILIENYSRKNGFEKALELCNDKTFGQEFSIAGIRWSAHLMDLDKIDQVLIDYPVINKENTKADLYVLHFFNQKPVMINENDFSRTLDEVLKVDKDIKAGDIRLRDSMLWDLGASTLKKSQTLECRKNITSPLIKKELTYYLEHNKDKMV